MSIKYYVLSPFYGFRGWKLLPYAVQNMHSAQTEFFDKHGWDLISKCDGNTPIDIDMLPAEDRNRYLLWSKGGLIIDCDKGTELYPEQAYLFYPSRFKQSVHWSITGKCNYRCKHCFMSAPQGVQGEPTWEQLMTMLDAFARCGIKEINLTGGEPLIRKDFWQLVDAILERRMIIGLIFTNGQLVNDSFFAELDKRDIYPSMQFSFDGVGYHDWLRGVPGAQDRVYEAWKGCRERGLRIFAAMTLFKDNRNSIRDTVNTLADMGVESLKICNAYPQGEWLNHKDHYLTHAEVYEAFLEYIPHFIEDGKPMTLNLEGFFNYDKGKDRIFTFSDRWAPEEEFGRVLMCGHVRRDMYVSPLGNVLPCMSMVGAPIEDRFPNMLSMPLEDILGNSSLYMDITNLKVSDFMEHNPECSECEYKNMCCGGCRAIALQKYPEDYLAPDPVLCEYFKGGWKDKRDIVMARLQLR